MKLQTKNERWQCAITAFAIALDKPLAELIEKVGHDGGEIIFPENAEPANRAGHSIYELIELAIGYGFSVTPLPLFIAHADTRNPQRFVPIGNPEERWSRFLHQVVTSGGAIECNGRQCRHLVAYDQGRIFNPDGEEFSFSREAMEERSLYPIQIWRIDPLCLNVTQKVGATKRTTDFSSAL